MKIRYRLKQGIVLFGDLLSYTLGLYIAIAIRRSELPNTDYLLSLLGIFISTFIIWFIVNYINGLYDLGSYENKTQFIRRFFETAGIALLVSIIFFYLHPNKTITPKTILVLTIIIGYGLSALWRFLAQRFIRGKHLQSRLLFVGVTKEVLELIALFQKRPQNGYLPVAIIEPHPPENVPDSIDCFKDINKMRAVINTKDIDIVVVSDHLKDNDTAVRELYELLFWPVHIHHLGAFYEIITGRISPTTFSESWFLEHLRNKEQLVYTRLRRVIDYIAALILFVVFVAIFPFIAVAIKINSSGPIFFTQARVGKSGNVFTLYKFRSMYALAKDGSAELDGYQFATKDDTRVTAIGKLLRKTRLDELPQWINLFKGDVTLIGPRPERPQIVEKLTEHMPYYPLRHIVAPGLTGWAVIHQQYTDTMERSLEKFQYDLFYIKNKSFLIDISIILRTINIILRGYGQ